MAEKLVEELRSRAVSSVTEDAEVGVCCCFVCMCVCLYCFFQVCMFLYVFIFCHNHHTAEGQKNRRVIILFSSLLISFDEVCFHF